MVTPVAWTSFATGCTPPTTASTSSTTSSRPTGRSAPTTRAGSACRRSGRSSSAAGREVVSLNLPMTYPPPRVRGLVVAGSDAPGLDWAFAQCPEFGAEICRAACPTTRTRSSGSTGPKTLDELRSQAARNRAIFRAQAEAAERADAADRLDGADGPLPQPRQPPAPALALPRRRRDRRPRAGLERGGRDAASAPSTRASAGSWSWPRSATRRSSPSRTTASARARRWSTSTACSAQAGLQRGLMYGTRFRYRAQRLGDRFHRWLTRRRPGGRAGDCPARSRGRSAATGSGPSPSPRSASSAAASSSTRRPTGDAARRRARPRARSSRSAARPATRRPATPLFRDVFSIAERYGIDPAAEGLPDVLALSADGYQAQAKWGVSLRNELLRPDPNLPGTHWSDGIIAIDAPGVRPGGHLRADLARRRADRPWPCSACRSPRRMEGRVLHEAFENPLAGPLRRPAPMIEHDPRFEALLAAGFGAECDSTPRTPSTGRRRPPWTRSENVVHDYILREFLPGEDPERADRRDAADHRRHPRLDQHAQAGRRSSKTTSASPSRPTRPASRTSTRSARSPG